jgi:hypothetical protein
MRGPFNGFPLGYSFIFLYILGLNFLDSDQREKKPKETVERRDK